MPTIDYVSFPPRLVYDSGFGGHQELCENGRKDMHIVFEGRVSGPSFCMFQASCMLRGSDDMVDSPSVMFSGMIVGPQMLRKNKNLINI